MPIARRSRIPFRGLVACVVGALLWAAPPARAQVPSPSNSTVPGTVIVSTTGGDCFNVVVRDVANNPIAGALTTVTFSSLPEFCAGQSHSGNTVSALTNASGIAQFCICALIRTSSMTATVAANGVTLAIRPAVSVEKTVTTITNTGSVNGVSMNYSSVAVQNAITMHLVRDDTGLSAAAACICWLHPKHHTPEGWCHDPPTKKRYSLDALVPSGGPIDEVIVTVEGTDTLRVSHHYSWTMTGDSLMSITDAAQWSGSAPNYCGATLSVDPYTATWHQVGPGHIHISYTEPFHVNGVLHTMRVDHDLTYPAGEVLDADVHETISNVTLTYDPGTQHEHTEFDQHLEYASGPLTPSMSGPGAAVAALLLAAMALIGMRRRRSLA